MSNATKANRIYLLHDLMVELGRVELQLEAWAGGNDGTNNGVHHRLRRKQSKLQQAVSRLVA